MGLGDLYARLAAVHCDVSQNSCLNNFRIKGNNVVARKRFQCCFLCSSFSVKLSSGSDKIAAIAASTLTFLAAANGQLAKFSLRNNPLF